MSKVEEDNESRMDQRKKKETEEKKNEGRNKRK
jgi:hypothetical protein